MRAANGQRALDIINKDDVRREVEKMILEKEWPAALYKLIALIDRGATGGVTTDQVVDYLTEKGMAKATR